MTQVDPVSPAADARLLPGDAVVEADGSAVTTPDTLDEQIRSAADGGYLRLYIYLPRAGRSFHAILKLTE